VFGGHLPRSNTHFAAVGSFVGSGTPQTVIGLGFLGLLMGEDRVDVSFPSQ